MSDTANLFVIPLVVTIVGTVVGLVVEYWVIQPMRGSKRSPTSFHNTRRATSQERGARSGIGSFISSSAAPDKPVESELSTVGAYYVLLLLFLTSASAAFTSAVILRLVSEEYYYYADPISILGSITELIVRSDFIFLIICVIMIMSGVVLWFLVDRSSAVKHAALWGRLPLSIVIGFLGAWLGLIIVPIVLFSILIILGGQSSISQSKKD